MNTSDETLKSLGEWMRLYGVSKSRLADILGVTRAAIYNWEGDRTRLSDRNRAALEKLMLAPPPDVGALKDVSPAYMRILCSHCGNPTISPEDGSFFCHVCGEPTVLACPKCGTAETRLDAMYCRACGWALTEDAQAAREEIAQVTEGGKEARERKALAKLKRDKAARKKGEPGL